MDLGYLWHLWSLFTSILLHLDVSTISMCFVTNTTDSQNRTCRFLRISTSHPPGSRLLRLWGVVESERSLVAVLATSKHHDLPWILMLLIMACAFMLVILQHCLLSGTEIRDLDLHLPNFEAAAGAETEAVWNSEFSGNPNHQEPGHKNLNWRVTGPSMAQFASHWGSDQSPPPNLPGILHKDLPFTRIFPEFRPFGDDFPY